MSDVILIKSTVFFCQVTCTLTHEIRNFVHAPNEKRESIYPIARGRQGSDKSSLRVFWLGLTHTNELTVEGSRREI